MLRISQKTFHLCLFISIAYSVSLPLSANLERDLPELPDFIPGEIATGVSLPKIDLPSLSHKQGLISGKKFKVLGFQFDGNTQLTNQELMEVSQQYIEQPITISDLHELRDNITRLYIQKGFINSGAILPDQSVKKGIVKFTLIEGVVGSIEAKTDGRLNSDYVKHPLRLSATPVINVFKLEQRLQMLQQDERIESIDARIEPSMSRGIANLQVLVKEKSPDNYFAEINNYHSPAIGAEGIKLSAHHNNITGSGNRISGHIEKTLGFSKVGLKYSQPFSKTDSRVDVQMGVSQSKVIIEENELDELDIKDESQYVRVSLHQLSISSLNSRFDWYISTFYQHGQTFIGGEPHSLGDPRDDGEIDLTGFRFGTDWRYRSNTQVIVIGFSNTIGFVLPDDDVDDDDVKYTNTPDGTSLIFNTNIQWARKLEFLSARVFSRLDLQLSHSPLYSAQQFSLGGHASIRGYRENLLVKDNGALASVEMRIPVWVKSGTRMSLAFFTDAGRAWQTDRKETEPRVLASIGTGIVGRINKRFVTQLYWAKALRDIDHLGESNIQDQGIHFSLSSQWR